MKMGMRDVECFVLGIVRYAVILAAKLDMRLRFG